MGRLTAAAVLSLLSIGLFRQALAGSAPPALGPEIARALSIVTWICFGLVAHSYFIYPVLLVACASIKRAVMRPRTPQAAPLPKMSILVSAHNEEDCIAEKMANFEALSYPRERLQILIGCDGCTDRTAGIIQESGGRGVTLVDVAERGGKIPMLNRLAMLADGDILLFSDANSMLDANALKIAAEGFSDPRVGCVAGRLRLKPTEDGQEGETAYWGYELLLKKLESELNMSLGASGSIYAIRRRLYREAPLGVVDDFVISMNVRAQGYRLVFDERMVAWEYTAATVREEFARHVRIGAGNFQALRHTWRLLLPTAGAVAFAYWSHKVLRWFAPFLIAPAFLFSILLLDRPLHALFAGGVALVMALGVAGSEMERRSAPAKIFAVPYYFVAMNAALVLGLIRVVSGQQITVWQRTARSR